MLEENLLCGWAHLSKVGEVNVLEVDTAIVDPLTNGIALFKVTARDVRIGGEQSRASKEFTAM